MGGPGSLKQGTISDMQIQWYKDKQPPPPGTVHTVLAGPYKPFPPELRNRDEIHIIRTWQYQSNNVLTTN